MRAIKEVGGVRKAALDPAKVTNGSEVFLPIENQSTYIPLGETHIADALANLLGLAIGLGLDAAGRRAHARARANNTPPMTTG